MYFYADDTQVFVGVDPVENLCTCLHRLLCLTNNRFTDTNQSASNKMGFVYRQ